MTREEIELVETLGRCWNKFRELPVEHSSDSVEFCQAIHVAQNIVLSREGLRVFREVSLFSQETLNVY